MKKVVNFFSNFKTIWMGIMLVVGGAVWAGDTRWMKKEDGQQIVKQIKLSNLQERAEEMEIQRGWETDPRQVKLLDSMINIKRSRINVLIQAKQIH